MASASTVAMIKLYYEASPQKWTEQMVHDAVSKGTLTAADFATITGKTYVADPRPSIDGGALGNNTLNWSNPS